MCHYLSIKLLCEHVHDIFIGNTFWIWWTKEKERTSSCDICLNVSHSFKNNKKQFLI